MRTGKIVVDTNLLLLWLAGEVDTQIVHRHRRLQRFEIDHLRILHEIISPYQGIVVTPHSLAELWNLLGEERGNWDQYRTEMLEFVREFVGSVVEIYHPAKALVSRNEIRWLGLADVSQIAAAIEGSFALTSIDGPLCHQALALGIETHHFWQIAEGP